MKVVIMAVFMITAGLPGIAATQDKILVDRIVAVVNDEIITLYDLDKEFEPYARNIKSLGYDEDKQMKLLFKFRSDLLNKLIDSTLADQEIKKNKLDVTEAEIDTMIERIKTSRSMTDETLRAGLAQEGLTMEEYRKEIAFFSAIKAAISKFTTVDRKLTQEEKNSALKQILDNAVIA
ncbi:MAG: SurA N-terminal domain-containing protein, partial [Deltaproteobacteria bacterium]|nr:SurA N-terminal domain-containing protein [Deltaproteobacteria bacterium]